MSCANKALLVVMVVTTLGLWGCTQSHSGAAAGTAKVRDLENRNAKLEEDYKAAVAEGADARKRLAETEEQLARMNQQLRQTQGALKERDQLRRQVTAAQTERNALQSRLQEFGRELQALAGRVDATAANPAAPATTTTTSAPAPGSL
jgi:chromosome segregation ATPase